MAGDHGRRWLTGLVYLAVSAVLSGGYLAVAAIRYLLFSRAVRQAMRESLLEAYWEQHGRTQHASFGELQADRGAYASWISSLSVETRREIRQQSLLSPIARSDGWRNEKAMAKLQAKAKWAADFATIILCAVSALFPLALAAQPATADDEGYNNSYHFLAFRNSADYYSRCSDEMPHRPVNRRRAHPKKPVHAPLS